MDWKSFVEKTKIVTEKSKPIFEKAQKYSSSAIGFVGKQIEQTPLFIKTEEEYNIHITEKRAICIAYSNSDAISEYIHLMMPIWKTQSWTDSAALKYIETSKNSELTQCLSITGPLEMRVSYMGEEQYRFHDIEDIKKWWKERNYIKDDTSVEIPKKDILKGDDKDKIDPITLLENKPRKVYNKKSTHI